MTDKELVRKDIEALYLGNLGTVEFDLQLPGRGENGSLITWQSDNPSLMGCLGRVTRPVYGRGNRSVILTARFAYGSCVEERQYPVTVLEQDNGVEVEEVLPIAVSAVRGELTHLPSVSAVRTREGRVIACALEWDGGLERIWDEAGVYEVRGRLRDTRISAACRVRVREASVERPLRPVKLAESLEGSVTLLEDSCFYDAQERVHRYLLRTDPDQWLYNFRKAAGLPVGNGSPMTGWDTCKRGEAPLWGPVMREKELCVRWNAASAAAEVIRYYCGKT